MHARTDEDICVKNTKRCTSASLLATESSNQPDTQSESTVARLLQLMIDRDTFASEHLSADNLGWHLELDERHACSVLGRGSSAGSKGGNDSSSKIWRKTLGHVQPPRLSLVVWIVPIHERYEIGYNVQDASDPTVSLQHIRKNCMILQRHAHGCVLSFPLVDTE